MCRASLAHAVTERDLQALEAALERAAQTGLPEEDTAEGRYGSWVAVGGSCHSLWAWILPLTQQGPKKANLHLARPVKDGA